MNSDGGTGGKTFDELARTRRSGVDALRLNGWEDGFRDLLAHLYPDNAHFIYELLQNAEDAGAREVSFHLRHDGLRVDHDGARMFTVADIESITGIGNSSKVEDVTRIGKFGVGFKAVFAYTQKPVIHSGEFSFELGDLFVPRRVTPDVRPGFTTFWFPFDRADKPADRAVDEVTRALQELSGPSLLFLRNIRTIACFLPGGEDRLLERRDLDEHVIAIESTHAESGPSYWYRVGTDVRVADSHVPVAFAFALTASEPGVRSAPSATAETAPGTTRDRKRSPGRPHFAVQPIDGQVFIYFPAVKETSGLRFHVHAPFASTVARDSVRDDEGNDELIAGIGQLIAASLPKMRDAGLVDDGLLAALPNAHDGVPSRYAVIRNQVLEAFRTQALTPVATRGDHRESRLLVRSVSALRASLSPDDVNVLRQISVGVGDDVAVGWLPERTGRAGTFLNSLDAISFASEDLAEVFERVGDLIDEDVRDDSNDEDEVDLKAWRHWLSAKDDKWLRSFYASLGRVSQQTHNPHDRYSYDWHTWTDPLQEQLPRVPLVRVRHGEGAQHVVGEEAFLPTAPGLTVDDLVLDALVTFPEGDAQPEKQDSNALDHFYTLAGLKTWDAAAQLDAGLAERRANPEIDIAGHVSDLRSLHALLRDKKVAAADYAAREIFLTAGPDGQLVWRAPCQTYVDAPFASTGLAALYESASFAQRDRRRPLASDYLDHELDIAALARTLGARDGISIMPTDPKQNPGFEWAWSRNENHNKVLRDWTILDFDAMVATDDETLLRALWDVVVTAPAERAQACYQANGAQPKHLMPSQLLRKLTTVPWVLDQDGNRNLPENMSAAELAPGLDRHMGAPLLERAGFGRKAATGVKEAAEAEAVARAFGFHSSDLMRRVGTLCQADPAALQEFIAQQEARSHLPTGASAAPEKRADRAAAVATGAAPRVYDKRVRSVYVEVPGHRSASKSYLREMYTNDKGVLICQVCLQGMPFRINDQYYFVAVQFVVDAELDLPENRLALCPTCAAKYRHARGTENDDLREDLLTQHVGSQESVRVDVVLAGESHEVRLVGKHAIDLQAALEAAADVQLRQSRGEDAG